ncbi:unnamed protein product [Phyllotreta striolata]|uniref:LRRCT domain-containing protein n=1 Tax=Phyllotreta striolata TaxID=444603 RepID=A0A9N9TGV6_PHYSR|nr:unnamed protein product [Phyllotreta striolata]
MLLFLYLSTILLLRVRPSASLTSNNCNFNSMCVCSMEERDVSVKTIHSISCLSTPFYKFPTLPEGSVSQLEVAGTKISILESESLAGCQVQALILTNNRIQHIADRSFSSLSKSITSLDLSYNRLDGVPFAALKDARNLQWINLHGNEIGSMIGWWSHMKTSLSTLFLGENDLTIVPNETSHSNSKNRQGLWHFRSLIWLNLDGNRIHSIENGSLPTCLKTASLSYNLLADFPVDLVAASPHLQWLYLRGNHIRLIPQCTFGRMAYLEKLDLAENYISTLPGYLFNNSLKIRDVNLAFNDFRMLTDNCFAGLSTGRIIFSYNSLEKMDYDAFNGILDTLEYLDLDHNNLQRIPEALKRLNSLKYLYLSWNFLKYISPSAFDNFCDSLKALSLSGNQLREIPSEALQNCTRISHFNIAYNEIVEIDRGDFQNWASNVRSLNLANNRIARLPANLFEDLVSLKELSLSFNPLKKIDKSAFIGLKKLESLELSFAVNKPDLIERLPNVKWLFLDNNSIHKLNGSNEVASDIRYLNLESNKIDSIPPGSLKSHSNLQNVRLSNNQLSTIETDAFRSLNALETVLLSNNKIRQFREESFTNLPNLTTIIASHNRLKTISSNTFSNLPSINKIDLYNNRLTHVSFNSFTNISSHLLELNVSRNQIVSCASDARVLNMRTFDLSYNNLATVPGCIRDTSGLVRLYLDFNIIGELENAVFMYLTSLERLGLQQNNVRRVGKRAFFGLQSLQTLDLSKNLIGQLHVGQFANMSKLRVLNLSGNHLSYLPKEIFKSTNIEMLDLSFNSFSVVPSSTLSDIGISLRYFTMRSNNIEHIDITTFPDIPLLQRLDLRNNKLTILPDNVFTSLGLLQFLDLSSNPLRSNFKELFHYAQSLKHLDLSNTGVTNTPYFPLPNLVFLNLSHNNIEFINKYSFQQLGKLKVLDLSRNNLNKIFAQLWVHLPNLKALDLSYNPIKEILADSFSGLQNLQQLNIQHLDKLVKFESESVIQLKIISKLLIQTWPKIENFSEKLCQLFSHTDQLRVLKILLLEKELTDQLLCVTNRKIRHLEITGKSLKTVNKDAFTRFTKNPQLLIKIHNTRIEELPSGLFSNMYKVAHLTLDLRNNQLTQLHPEIFYGNSSRWKSDGTTLITGGLLLSNNPFRCDCHLTWLSHWMRRWTRESLQSHSSPAEGSVRMIEAISEATCIDYRSNTKIPIVDLQPEDTNCHASALSNGARSTKTTVIFSGVLTFLALLR